MKKLQQATSFDAPDLEFVKDYKYTLGVEDLVLYGAQQCVSFPLLSWLWLIRSDSISVFRSHAPVLVSRSFDSGEEDFVRYPALLNETTFVRASGSGRIIDSARNWSAGEKQ